MQTLHQKIVLFQKYAETANDLPFDDQLRLQTVLLLIEENKQLSRMSNTHRATLEALIDSEMAHAQKRKGILR